jgi:hypothetical protein
MAQRAGDLPHSLLMERDAAAGAQYVEATAIGQI